MCGMRSRPEGYSETRTYNAMLQLTRESGLGMDMEYVYTAGANNGRIAQSIDHTRNETVNYTYDAVNRLSGVSATGDAGGAWGQGYTYDGFGNLVGKTAAGAYPAWNGSVDPATNGGLGPGTYDVEKRMIAGPNGEQYVYDQAGKRVKKKYGTSEEYYFYGIGGQKLVTLPCVSGENGLGCPAGRQYNVYFGGKLMKSRGVLVATDRLGSVRASQQPDGSFAGMSYYPYGEERTSTADGREKFGTYTRDNATTDYADQRYYAVGTGRFNTPDPTGMLSAQAELSQTWNLYAYVHGDPVNYSDPSGTNQAASDGSSGNGESGPCGPNWINDPSLVGPCTGGGGGGGAGGGGGGGGVFCGTGIMGFVPVPNPACYVPLPPPPQQRPKPDCMLKVEIRSTQKVPGATHASVAVTDAQGYTFTMEGFPDYAYLPFGNLGVLNTDHDIHDTQWGPTLTSGMIPDLCDRIASIETGEAYYASHEVRYGYVTSNTFARWLLQNGNLDQYFSTPPGGVGWDRNLYGNLF